MAYGMSHMHEIKLCDSWLPPLFPVAYSHISEPLWFCAMGMLQLHRAQHTVNYCKTMLSVQPQSATACIDANVLIRQVCLLKVCFATSLTSYGTFVSLHHQINTGDHSALQNCYSYTRYQQVCNTMLFIICDFGNYRRIDILRKSFIKRA